MKSRMIILLAALAMLAMPTRDAKAAPDLKTQHLAKILRHFPNQATPEQTVEKLVLRLVKRDPKRAKKYYKIAITKLAYAPPYRANETKLAVLIGRILKRSGLSESQLKKILSQIGGHECDCGAPSPTPTPTPLPTP